MPSKSKAQAKLMNIAAHTPGGYGGVPQSVGKEFHAADKRKAGHLSSTRVHEPSGPQSDPVEHHAKQAMHHYKHGLEKG